MNRRESWAESRRPTAAEKKKAKQLLARPGFPPKSAADRYAEIYRDKVESAAQVQHGGGRCRWCEEIPEEPHLHGAKLFQDGRELF